MDWTPEQLTAAFTNAVCVLVVAMLAFALGYWHRSRQLIRSVSIRSGVNAGLRKSAGDVVLNFDGGSYRLIDVNHHGQLKSQAAMIQPWTGLERRGHK